MVENKSSSALENDKSSSPQTPKATGRKARLILYGVIALLVSIALIGAAAWVGYQSWQQLTIQQQTINALAQNLAESQSKVAALGQQVNRASEAHSRIRSDFSQTFSELEQRLNTHSKRLRSLSTTTREDWRLAEAEFLLQLANQRLVIERNPQSAIALLEATDDILKALDQIDLFAIRQGVNRDLMQLKLADKIDRPGLYVKLSALLEQIAALPLYPPQIRQTQATDDHDAESVENPKKNDWMSVMQRSLQNVAGEISGYIRIQHHDRELKGILPPESQVYLRQNMHFLLLQAQTAMLREEQSLYQQSLKQTRRWLSQYFLMSEEKVKRFDQEVAALQEQKIVQSLPDISQSLAQLQAYIERLHKLSVDQNKPSITSKKQEK